MSRNNSVGIDHEKHETHEMMRWRAGRLVANLSLNGERVWIIRFVVGGTLFRVFSVFRGGLRLHGYGLVRAVARRQLRPVTYGGRGDR